MELHKLSSLAKALVGTTGLLTAPALATSFAILATFLVLTRVLAILAISACSHF